MTITTNLTGAKVHRSDDIAVWPDGTWAEIGDVLERRIHLHVG